MFRVTYLLPLVLLILVSCRKDPSADFVDLDLLSYGMPLVIKAPANADIKKMDLVYMKDITVMGGNDYNVQIFEAEATTHDEQVVKARLLNEVKANPYFYGIVREDPAGFIYESHVDSNYVNYGFRYIRIQADKEYVFQQGLRGKFSLESVEAMYDAVQ
jgi:hypothetical protein